MRKRKMDGIELISAERQRQIDSEGWTPEHDDEHVNGELEDAARCYWSCGLRPGSAVRILEGTTNPRWPWDWRWFKPWDNSHNGYFPVVDRLRCLIKAGALAMAEEERLERCGVVSEAARIRQVIIDIAGDIDRLQRTENGGTHAPQA